MPLGGGAGLWGVVGRPVLNGPPCMGVNDDVGLEEVMCKGAGGGCRESGPLVFRGEGSGLGSFDLVPKIGLLWDWGGEELLSVVGYVWGGSPLCGLNVLFSLKLNMAALWLLERIHNKDPFWLLSISCNAGTGI